jgi:hypothetical protein
VDKTNWGKKKKCILFYFKTNLNGKRWKSLENPGNLGFPRKLSSLLQWYLDYQEMLQGICVLFLAFGLGRSQLLTSLLISVLW